MSLSGGARIGPYEITGTLGAGGMGEAWRAAAPTKLFAGRFFFSDGIGTPGKGRTYDASPDGRRFLMIKTKDSGGDELAARNIVVAQHFDEELKRLVPTN